MQITEQEREERRERKIRRWSYRTGVSEKDKAKTLSLELSRLGKRKQPAWLENASLPSFKQTLSTAPKSYVPRAASDSPGKLRRVNTSSTEALSPVAEVYPLTSDASDEDDLEAHIDNDLEAELEMELEAQLKNIATADIDTERSLAEARFAKSCRGVGNDTSVLVANTWNPEVESNLRAELKLRLPEDDSTDNYIDKNSQTQDEDELARKDTALKSIHGTDISEADLVAELEAALEAQVTDGYAAGIARGTRHD